MFSTATTISSTSSVNIIGTTGIISNNNKMMKKKKNLSEMQKIVLMGTTHVPRKKNYFKNFLKKTLICLRSQMKDLITNWIRQQKNV